MFRTLLFAMLFTVAAKAEPGRLISYEAIAAAPAGAASWRIRYETRDHEGRPVESTGTVTAPIAGDGPRDVVAWAHGTVGIAESCAPSAREKPLARIPGVEAMLARGWVVIATDYPGLGTPGPHGYMVGSAAANAMLDSVRAARALSEAKAGNRFAFWGHSQGGHAVLWASAAATTAPDLQLVGTVAASPPTLLADNVRAMSRGAIGTLGGFILQSWSEVYGAPLSDLVDAETADVVRRGTAGCFGRDAGFGQVGRLIKLSRRLRDIDVLANPRWSDLVARNAAPLPDATSAPVKLVSAVEDSLVADSVTRDFAARACAAGARLAYFAAEDAGHSSSAFKTAEATIAFIADRFAGVAVPPCDATTLAAGSAPAQP